MECCDRVPIYWALQFIGRCQDMAATKVLSGGSGNWSGYKHNTKNESFSGRFRFRFVCWCVLEKVGLKYRRKHWRAAGGTWYRKEIYGDQNGVTLGHQTRPSWKSRFSTFGKWNRPPTSAKSIRIYVPTSWIWWFLESHRPWVSGPCVWKWHYSVS